MMYLQVAAGLVVLLVGGDVLVRGAVALATRFGVSKMLIGVTVVACGTSAPELVVSVDAVFSGVPSIAIGNVVGSNIANVLLVLGASALLYPIVCEDKGALRDGSLMMGASLLFAAFCWSGVLSRWQGGVLLALLAAFLIFAYRKGVEQGNTSVVLDIDYDNATAATRSPWLALALVTGGCAGLVLGAHWLIEGGVAIARTVGVSEAVIGLTLIAVGTSLPELATSMVAALRRHGEVAMGNVLGSNMFNVLGIMGVTALLVPVPVPDEILHVDIWAMLGTAALVAAFALSRAPIGRLLGLVFLGAYVVYVLTLFTARSDAMAMAG